MMRSCIGFSLNSSNLSCTPHGKDDTIFTGRVEHSIRDHRGRVETGVRAWQRSGPNRTSRSRIKADDVAPGPQEIDATLVLRQRTHEHSHIVSFPHAMRAGHIASTVESYHLHVPLAPPDRLVRQVRGPSCHR